MPDQRPGGGGYRHGRRGFEREAAQGLQHAAAGGPEELHGGPVGGRAPDLAALPAPVPDRQGAGGAQLRQPLRGGAGRDDGGLRAGYQAGGRGIGDTRAYLSSDVLG